MDFIHLSKKKNQLLHSQTGASVILIVTVISLVLGIALYGVYLVNSNEIKNIKKEESNKVLNAAGANAVEQVNALIQSKKIIGYKVNKEGEFGEASYWKSVDSDVETHFGFQEGFDSSSNRKPSATLVVLGCDPRTLTPDIVKGNYTQGKLTLCQGLTMNVEFVKAVSGEYVELKVTVGQLGSIRARLKIDTLLEMPTCKILASSVKVPVGSELVLTRVVSSPELVLSKKWTGENVSSYTSDNITLKMEKPGEFQFGSTLVSSAAGELSCSDVKVTAYDPPSCTLKSDHGKYPYYCAAPNPWAWKQYALTLEVKGGTYTSVKIDGAVGVPYTATRVVPNQPCPYINWKGGLFGMGIDFCALWPATVTETYTAIEPFNPMGGTYTFPLPNYLLDKTIVAELDGPEGKVSCSTTISSSCSPETPVWSSFDAMWLFPRLDRPYCTYVACRWGGCFEPRNCGVGCFDSRTPIKLANGKFKEARKIEPRDLLWNPKLKKASKIKRIVVGPEVNPLIEFTVGKHKIRVSQKHPMITRDSGVKLASQVQKGEFVLTAKGTFLPVTVRKEMKVNKSTVVYNFEMESETGDEEDHLIEANGIATGDYYLQSALETQVTR